MLKTIVSIGFCILPVPLLDRNVWAAAGIGQKAIHLGLVLVIFFLDYLAKEDRKWYLKITDLFFIIASAGSLIYIMSIDSTIDLRSGVVYTYDIVFGVLLVLALIEGDTQICGHLTLQIVTGCFILYGFFGQYMPGFLAHVGMDLPRFISIVYLGTDGIYGTAIYASASYIVLFVILGRYLMRRVLAIILPNWLPGHLDALSADRPRLR